MPALILAVMAATLLGPPIRPQEGATPASKDQTNESIKKVKELRKERIAVLRERTDAFEAEFKNARATIHEMLQARQQLIEAELETATTEAERVDLYKNLVVMLKVYESIADDRHKAGRGTKSGVLKVKAMRLEAELHLEQAKMKVAKAGR